MHSLTYRSPRYKSSDFAGSYLFTIDRPTERINLVSPMSGSHSYFFDQEEQLWLSMNTDR